MPEAQAEELGKAANIAVISVRVKYHVKTRQDAINIRVNAFALDLLAESLGDQNLLLEGGALFAFPEDHNHRPIWILVTGEAPLVTAVEPDPEKCVTCDGSGRIASGEEGAPWTAWECLPPGADLAVRAGIVRPLMCPACAGLGRNWVIPSPMVVGAG